MYSRILVPIDGTACSREAVTHAVAIAKAMGALIVFLFVMDTLSQWDEGVVTMAEALERLKAQGQASLNDAEVSALRAGLRTAGELVEGSPLEVIARRSADFDLVVMASHGRALLKRLTIGSVTRGVLHRVTRPVLVIRCARGEHRPVEQG